MLNFLLLKEEKKFFFKRTFSCCVFAGPVRLNLINTRWCCFYLSGWVFFIMKDVCPHSEGTFRTRVRIKFLIYRDFHGQKIQHFVINNLVCFNTSCYYEIQSRKVSGTKRNSSWQSRVFTFSHISWSSSVTETDLLTRKGRFESQS